MTFVELFAGNEPAVGFDLASTPDRNKAIESAFATDKVTATAPVRLVQEHGEQPGILLMQAVPEGPSGPGLVLVVLQMGTFTTKLKEPYQETLDLKLAMKSRLALSLTTSLSLRRCPIDRNSNLAYVATSFKQRLPRSMSHGTEAGKVGLLWRPAF